jgi:hypothetical protein
MASVAASVARIKRDGLGALGRDVVEQGCAEFGHAWRDRELDPATTVALFVQQVLHGNLPCSEVRHLAGKHFTPGAYCQARARLPLRVTQSLLTRVCDAALPATRQPNHLWLGRHRVFHVDGSTFSMPDTPELRGAFGLPHGPASPAAASRRLTCWCCSTPGRARCRTRGPRHCAPATSRSSPRRTRTWTRATC